MGNLPEDPGTSGYPANCGVSGGARIIGQVSQKGSSQSIGSLGDIYFADTGICSTFAWRSCRRSGGCGGEGGGGRSLQEKSRKDPHTRSAQAKDMFRRRLVLQGKKLVPTLRKHCSKLTPNMYPRPRTEGTAVQAHTLSTLFEDVFAHLLCKYMWQPFGGEDCFETRGGCLPPPWSPRECGGGQPPPGSVQNIDLFKSRRLRSRSFTKPEAIPVSAK